MYMNCMSSKLYEIIFFTTERESNVVLCLWVALATTVSKGREHFKKLLWVSDFTHFAGENISFTVTVFTLHPNYVQDQKNKNAS